LKSAVRHVEQDNSMPPEEVALFFIMASMGLSVYGALISFVPSAFWLRWGTYLSVTATLLLTTYLYWGFGTGRMKMQEGASKLKKFLLCLFYHLSSSGQYGWSPFMRWQISIRLHLEVKTTNQYFWLRNEVEVGIHVNTGLKVNRSSQRFQTTSASLIRPMKLYLLTQLLFA